MRRLQFALVLAAVVAAGCSASGAGTSNFDLKPGKVGWFAGDEAHFNLSISKSLLNGAPTFTLDRRFALEELRFEEKGVTFGGDYETKEPDAVKFRLVRGNLSLEEVTLDKENPNVEIVLQVPESLRDSEYILEMKLFNVGWVKSDAFRVDRR